MTPQREVKDSLIFKDNDPKNKDDQAKVKNNTKKENIEPKKESEKKDDHSFYDKKDHSEQKNWFRRHLKLLIIILIIFIILLALGLGLGLGLSNKEEKSGIKFGDEYYTLEQIEEFIIDNQNDPAQYETNYLKDNAVVWGYKVLIDKGLGSKKDLDNAENKADNQISDEKDTYRDQYGNDWKKEWNKNLLSLGFDTEDQYRNNLISESLLSSISTILTEDTYIYFDDSTDPLTKKYRSTLETPSSRYYGFNGDFNQQTIFYDDPILNKTVINHQFLFDLYQKIYKPINYEDILIPFTFENPDRDGLTSKTESFALTTDNIDDVWVFLADLAVISYQNIYNTSIDDWEFLDFNNTDYSSAPTFTDSGVTSLSDSVSANSTVSLVLMEVYDNLISENYQSNSDFDNNEYNSSLMFSRYYAFFEEVGLEYRDVFKDIFAPSAETFPITNLNKYQYFIPGYGATTEIDSNDNVIWTYDSLPTTDQERYDYINQTFDGEYTDVYINNLTGQTGGNQVVAQVNKGFYAQVFDYSNLIDNTDRQIFYHLQIPTINHYNYDQTTGFTFSNVKSNITNDKIDNNTNIEEDYYLTQSIDGMHLVHDNVFNDQEESGISDAQVMLSYQLDQKLLQNNPDSISQLYQYQYDIIESYQSWLTTNAKDIIFNQYLNYLDQTYNPDGNEFTDQEKSALENGEDLDWELKADPNEILGQFYNQVFWNDISKTTTQVARSNDFFDKYGDIYLGDFDVANWNANLHNLLSYFSFEGNDFELKTIDQIYQSGNLSN